jgi:protein TonB
VRSEPQTQAELQPETDQGTAVMQPKPRRVEDLQQAKVPPVVATPNVNTKPKAALPAGLNRSQLIAAIADAPLEDPPTPHNERTRRLDEAPLTTPTTDAETAYLAMWRRKCERLGRLNYPPGNIQGELVMQVSIFSNGHLDYVRIAHSSGSSLLDQAALETVRQAAPYQPFSVEMRKAYDRLEFTRTWQYSKFGTDINR